MPATPTNEAREVARAAARWLALLESGKARESDLLQLEAWRNASGSHERAWQKAQLLRQRFSELPGALAMATLDRPDAGRRRVLKQALGVAALVPAAWMLGRQMPLEAWVADVHTGIGEQKRLTLADGSSLQLNTDSAVNIDLAAHQVTLLRGEIALDVHRHAHLTVQVPFGRVMVGDGEVCMRLLERDCRVAVVKGAVQLQPLHGGTLSLYEGQQASLHATGTGPVGTTDNLLLGWRDGVLMVEDQPLGDFLRDLRRYRSGLLRWEPELETLRVTGTFRLDDTDRVLALLAASLPLEVHARTRYWITLSSRKNLA